jgi:3-hydroxyacyl-[acyl-carrier-protein] dehydratase
MKFLLLDKVRSIVPGKSAEGVKCWSLDNEIFDDHFPGFPTTPGVLLTESMAQLAGILVEESFYKEYGRKEKGHPVLSIIQKAKFKHFVQPGDQCILQAELISIDKDRGAAATKTFVDGKLVCEATLNFIIISGSAMGDNPYLEKRAQYMHSIMPKEWKP